MAMATHDALARRGWLSQALKALRRRRGLRAEDVAREMRMPLRSFEYFEAGHGRLNLDRVHEFASVLNADPFAILLAMDMGSPNFAVRSADNKLVTILNIALQDFDAATGDAISQLDPQTLMASFAKLFDELASVARERAALADRRLADRPSPDGESSG